MKKQPAAANIMRLMEKYIEMKGTDREKKITRKSNQNH